MSIKSTTIAITDDDGETHKVTKIKPYKKDGFAVFAPYHSARRGYMFKHRVDYAKTDAMLYLDDCVEYEANDQVKLSIHLSGFVQFSGVNQSTIRSGVDADTGKPKGIGIIGDGRLEVSSGPLFGVMLWGLDDFRTVSPTKSGVMSFKNGDFYFRRHQETDQQGYLVEVFMFPRSMFRNVTGVGTMQQLKVKLPYHTLLDYPHELRVVDLPGQYAFLGVMVSKISVDFPTSSGFSLHGPAFPDPETGEFMSIAAMYPHPEWEEGRETCSLDYESDPVPPSAG